MTISLNELIVDIKRGLFPTNQNEPIVGSLYTLILDNNRQVEVCFEDQSDYFYYFKFIKENTFVLKSEFEFKDNMFKPRED